MSKRVRGGHGQFTWDSVVRDKHRENYLGQAFHSTQIRTFNNPNPKKCDFYLKEGGKEDESQREGEIREVKEREERLMRQLLGLPEKPAETLELSVELPRDENGEGRVGEDESKKSHRHHHHHHHHRKKHRDENREHRHRRDSARSERSDASPKRPTAKRRCRSPESRSVRPEEERSSSRYDSKRKSDY
ncbi:uncharacterized protein LOC126323727 [Schistocerca gregaria]|uniref:uncharacterized protein LOC126323727 n=1 Tax=Schistocerca gregaria TaxID=7010 RepID=UPI00211ECB96|nr:uncharacterized protein LOC126323727 [Schistocerca gregaria]